MQIKDPQGSWWRQAASTVLSSIKSHIPFTNKETDPIESREVFGRKLAMLHFLPGWDGFCVSTQRTEMTPNEALSQISQVCETLWRSKLTINGQDHTEWIPDGFNGEVVIKLNQYNLPGHNYEKTKYV